MNEAHQSNKSKATRENTKTEAPEGFATVAQWWGINEPESLGLLENPIRSFEADEGQLQALVDWHGLSSVRVKASAFMRQFGRTEATAFPVSLLNDFYPVNP